MRATSLSLVGVLFASGCAPWSMTHAPWMSHIAISSNKPVATVASCIGGQWNRHYPQVSTVTYGSRVVVRAAGLIDAVVWPTVYGSTVRLSTFHHEMLERGHPVISSAIACAN
jgi:hypothetical protein